MEVTLNSYAEHRAEASLKFQFCKKIKLEEIKERVAGMLNHIGDDGMFAEYTMHDISHVDGMLILLDKVIPERTKEIMTSADWLMIVLAVYFHDLGMHIPAGEYDDRNNDEYFVKTKSEMLSNAEIKSYVDSLEGDKGEKFLYQEYVRRNHGKRIYDWITNCDRKDTEPYKMINEMLGGLDESFRKDLAKVCQSHQEYVLKGNLQSVDEAYGSSPDEKVNLLYVSVLLRTADILHLTHDRTPDDEYRIISPQNTISVVEWAKQRAVKNVDIRKERNENDEIDNTIPPHMFVIQAKFTDDKGYFSFKSEIQRAIEEIRQCHEWCEESRKKNGTEYYYPWNDIDTSRVEAEGFSKDKLRFEIDQQNILKLLTGHTLYNDSTVVMRELIQNAMDAGKLQDAKGKTGSSYQSKVEIEWNSHERKLRIADNATGMKLNDITNFLLKVGASKYQSEEFRKDYPDFHSISRFGIGLLTCFMISDDVDIYTLDEEEAQCHLLKIRNLNGEYLMRNDADRSHILEGKHGTTFELCVRPNVKMTDVESQIRQWIVVPFGEITLSIDNRAPVKIGFHSVGEAIEDFAKKLKGVDLSNGNFRVANFQENGVSMAILQRKNTLMNVWYPYTYSENEYFVEAPIGICIEGVRVTDATPGVRSRLYIALVNCVGKESPATNVARNALEASTNLDKMYETIYMMYMKMYTNQMRSLQENYSTVWAVNEINYLLDNFNRDRFSRQFVRKDLLNLVLKDIDCCLIDNGSNVRLYSINNLPEIVNTIDSMAFSSAVSLLKDMTETGKTAYGLLTELEKKTVQNENVLLLDSMSVDLRNIFMDTYEVERIYYEVSKRKITFTWKKKMGLWYIIKLKRRHGASLMVNVCKDSSNIQFDGLNDREIVVTGDNIFVLSNSPICSFMLNLIESGAEENTLDIVGHLFSQIILESITGDDTSLDKYLNSDDNYLKSELYTIFTKDDLKAVARNCGRKVVNIRKYYRYGY